MIYGGEVIEHSDISGVVVLLSLLPFCSAVPSRHVPLPLCSRPPVKVSGKMKTAQVTAAHSDQDYILEHNQSITGSPPSSIS